VLPVDNRLHVNAAAPVSSSVLRGRRVEHNKLRCRQTRRQTATPGRKSPRPLISRSGIGPQFVGNDTYPLGGSNGLERKAIETERGADIDSRAHDRLKIGPNPPDAKSCSASTDTSSTLCTTTCSPRRWPSPIPADQHTKIRGAQLSIHPGTTELPGNPGRPCTVRCVVAHLRLSL
jgi:hypothetical protein